MLCHDFERHNIQWSMVNGQCVRCSMFIFIWCIDRIVVLFRIYLLVEYAVKLIQYCSMIQKW